MRQLELFFDVVQLIDILIVFLTPLKAAAVDEKVKLWFANRKKGKRSKHEGFSQSVEADKTEWVIDMRIIAVEYAKTHLLWDALACLPGLLTLEELLILYLFKVLRFLKIGRVLTFQDRIG